MCLRIILQQFRDIGHEFIFVEWFGHIVIRSLFQSPEAIAVLRFAGQHEDFDILGSGGCLELTAIKAPIS